MKCNSFQMVVLCVGLSKGLFTGGHFARKQYLEESVGRDHFRRLL